MVFHLGSCADAYDFNLQTVLFTSKRCLRSSSLMNVRVLLAIAPGSEVASILMVNPLGSRFLSMYQRLTVGEGVVDILTMDFDQHDQISVRWIAGKWAEYFPTFGQRNAMEMGGWAKPE
jgi:hypothetical protein